MSVPKADGVSPEVLRLRGAAHRSVLHRLENDPYLDDWDTRHEWIADWHLDVKGHRVCGCGIHQAWCPECFDYSILDEMEHFA